MPQTAMPATNADVVEVHVTIWPMGDGPEVDAQITSTSGHQVSVTAESASEALYIASMHVAEWR